MQVAVLVTAIPWLVGTSSPVTGARPPLRGLSLHGPAARVNAATGREGNESLSSGESEPLCVA